MRSRLFVSWLINKQMGDCYTTELFTGNHPEPPVITYGKDSAVKSYIITMDNSGRSMRQLQLITPNTYLLQNKGYKRCNKPGVSTSMRDLFHANQHIVKLEWDNPDPVFIFEDDAELLRPEEAILSETIRLARRPGIDCIALGCLPLLAHKQPHLAAAGFKDWFWVDIGFTTHGLLLSAAGRRKLAALRVPSFLPHDALMYRQLRVLTPRSPIAGQLHPTTENSKTWDKSGLLKTVIYDPASCETSAYRCYTSFHSHLPNNGMAARPLAGLLALLSTVAVIGVTL